MICFFTKDNEYADLAARLEACLRKYNLEYELVGIQSIDPWELNCAFKARFVQEQWEKSDIPIVWIDADATVEQEPTLFRQIICDFALVKNAGWEFSSGTVFLANRIIQRP